MGRGDKKTAKGKRFQGSFGKSRPAIRRKKLLLQRKKLLK
jgi:30S ribosomal protein S31